MKFYLLINSGKVKSIQFCFPLRIILYKCLRLRIDFIDLLLILVLL